LEGQLQNLDWLVELFFKDVRGITGLAQMSRRTVDAGFAERARLPVQARGRHLVYLEVIVQFEFKIEFEFELNSLTNLRSEIVQSRTSPS
jgi:hypothetical protein